MSRWCSTACWWVLIWSLISNLLLHVIARRFSERSQHAIIIGPMAVAVIISGIGRICHIHRERTWMVVLQTRSTISIKQSVKFVGICYIIALHWPKHVPTIWHFWACGMSQCRVEAIILHAAAPSWAAFQRRQRSIREVGWHVDWRSARVPRNILLIQTIVKSTTYAQHHPLLSGSFEVQSQDPPKTWQPGVPELPKTTATRELWLLLPLKI